MHLLRIAQARGGAGFVAAGRTLYVIGGFNGKELSDMHAFDTATGAWRQLHLADAAQQLPGRSVAGIAAVPTPGDCMQDVLKPGNQMISLLEGGAANATAGRRMWQMQRSSCRCAAWLALLRGCPEVNRSICEVLAARKIYNSLA